MKRRIFCAVMTVVLVLTMLPVIAAAEGAVEIAFTQRETKAGATQVQVGVAMSNNPGLVTATIPVTWDNDVLHLANVIPSEDILSAGWIGMGMDEYKSNGTYYLAWDNDLAEADFTTEVGCLAELVFDIVDPSKDTETTLAFDMDDPIANVMNFAMEDLRETVTVNAANGTVSVAAEAGGDNPVVPEGAQFAFSNIKGKPGETVDVVVSIENNPGIAAFGITVDYSDIAEYVTLVEMVPGTTFDNVDGDVSKNPYTLNAYGADNKVDDGVVATLRFKIVDSCEDCELTVNTSIIEVFDEMGSEVTVGISDFVITVKNYIVGDVTGDDKVNRADLIKMARYFATYEDAKDLNADAADVNKDGKLNRADLIYMARYFAGYITSFE